MGLKNRYLLSMVGFLPLFFLFVLIRTYIDGSFAPLFDSLIPGVLVFGVVNVAVANFIFSPINQFLKDPKNNHFPQQRIIRLAQISAFWICLLVLASHTLGQLSGEVAEDWPTKWKWLRLLSISVYFAVLMYFVIQDFNAYLRRDIQARLGLWIEPSGSGFLYKLLLAMLVTGAIPYLLMVSVVASMQGEALHNEIRIMSIQIIVAVVIAIFFIMRSVNRPIGDLLTAFDNVGSGDLQQHTAVTTHDEIGALAMGFNHMTGQLEERAFLRETMGKFVPESIAAEVLQDRGALSPQTREATVLFTDIEGFTAISERVSPETLINMLNDYFSVVSKPVLTHGGVITQFQGDAMLVTFNVPVEDKNHARNAIKAALEIVTASESQTFQGEAINTRVGINTGVIVGGIVSGGDRMGYTVHGDQVNLAARLEQMNKEKGTRILASERTVELAGDVAEFTSVGEVKVRGLNKPVTIYTPVIPSKPAKQDT